MPARDLSGSGQYLTRASGLGLGANDSCTFGGWFWLDDTSATRVLMSLGLNGSGSERRLLVYYVSVNAIQAWTNTYNAAQSAGATSQATGAWFFAAARYTGATARAVWHAGAIDEKVVTASLTTAPDQVRVGATGTASALLDGRAAYTFVYGTDLSAGDLSALAAGLHPTLVRPASLLDCWDLGIASPEPGRRGNLLTLTGSPSIVDGPRIVYPRGRSMVALGSASGGGTTYQEAITLSAVAALTDSARAVFRSAITMTADATVADTARADLVAATTLAAVADFAAASQATFPASFALTADSTLSSASRADLVAAATLTADAGLSAVAVAQMVASLTLAADAGLAAASRLLAVAAATLTADAVLSATSGGPQTYQGSITLAAHATLVQSAVLQAVGAVGLTADTGLTAESSLRAAASLTFALQASIDAAATQMHAAAVALDAQTGITAASRADYVASLSLAVAAVLQAAGAVAGAPTYTVLRVTAESLRAATATGETLRAADVTDEELL